MEIRNPFHKNVDVTLIQRQLNSISPNLFSFIKRVIKRSRQVLRSDGIGDDVSLEDTDMDKPKNSMKNLSQCQFFYRKNPEDEPVSPQ
jgi:hypothetical protein